VKCSCKLAEVGASGTQLIRDTACPHHGDVAQALANSKVNAQHDQTVAEIGGFASSNVALLIKKQATQAKETREQGAPNLPKSTGEPVNIPGDPRPSSFDVLPVDDSHASKVMRAAAAYAKATNAYALELANVERLKGLLMAAEAHLHNAENEKQHHENELKTLVNGFIEKPKSTEKEKKNE
jgi:hypothetical protein